MAQQSGVEGSLIVKLPLKEAGLLSKISSDLVCHTLLLIETATGRVRAHILAPLGGRASPFAPGPNLHTSLWVKCEKQDSPAIWLPCNPPSKSSR